MEPLEDLTKSSNRVGGAPRRVLGEHLDHQVVVFKFSEARDPEDTYD